MFEKQPWMQRAGEYPRSDNAYFDLLARAVFSAGLGPKVVEARWDSLRAAFHAFDPDKVRLMDEGDVGLLLTDPNVIRNRRKIEAVIKNAQIFVDTSKGYKSFHTYLHDSGAAGDLEATAETLSKVFVHLGRTSALLFLFSAGWRPREVLAS
jgi:DNA-3-methyladenine glycosylase I